MATSPPQIRLGSTLVSFEDSRRFVFQDVHDPHKRPAIEQSDLAELIAFLQQWTDQWLVDYFDPNLQSWERRVFTLKHQAEDFCDWLENHGWQVRVQWVSAPHKEGETATPPTKGNLRIHNAT